MGLGAMMMLSGVKAARYNVQYNVTVLQGGKTVPWNGVGVKLQGKTFKKAFPRSSKTESTGWAVLPLDSRGERRPCGRYKWYRIPLLQLKILAERTEPDLGHGIWSPGPRSKVAWRTPVQPVKSSRLMPDPEPEKGKDHNRSRLVRVKPKPERLPDEASFGGNRLRRRLL